MREALLILACLFVYFQAESQELIQFNQKLAHELTQFHDLNGKNFFCSPYSHQRMMAMLFQGSEGKTQKEFQKFMNYQSTSESYSAELKTLHTNNIWKTYGRGNYFRFYNAVSVNKSYPLDTVFIKNLRSYYRTKFFEYDPDHSDSQLLSLNNWIGKKTRGQVRDLVKPSDMNAANGITIYDIALFKGKWTELFKESKDVEVFMGRNKEEPHDFMQSSERGYSRYENGVTYAAIPFRGFQRYFIVAMPDSKEEDDNISTDFDDLLSGEQFQLDITLPKIEVNSKDSFELFYASQGLQTIFGPEANFSNMFEKPESICIQKIKSIGMFKMDLKGAEGVTVLESHGDSWGIEEEYKPEKVVVDKPFYFYIVDKKSKVIMFMGAYAGG